MKRENKQLFTIALIELALVLFFVGYLGYVYITHDRDVIKWDKCEQEIERILEEGYTSDEIMIMKSISPEFNYYEMYIPEYAVDGRICVIQNVNDNEFFIINSELNTDPNVAQ